MFVTDVLRALWLFLPAFVANMSPVFMAKLIPKWKAPIDGGRVGKDGQRILGPGKTWRGLVGGAVAGALVAVLMAHVAPAEGAGGWFAGLDFGLKGHLVGCDAAPPANATTTTCVHHEHASLLAVAAFGAVMGLMALVGDFVKSYFKRRRKIERGGSWFPFDQLDFVVFGLLGMELAQGLLPHGWVQAVLFPWAWLILLLATPLLHLLVNRIGYWLGLKEVPW